MHRRVIPVSGSVRSVNFSEAFEVAVEEISPEEQARLDEEAREKAEQEAYEAEIQERVEAQIKQQIHQLQEEHEQTLQAAKKESYQSGYDGGKADGIHIGSAEVDPLRERFFQLAETIGEEQKRILKEAEHVILHLSFLIAKRVITRELQTQPELIIPIVQEALKLVADEPHVVLHIHPDDLEAIKQDDTAMEILKTQVKNIEITTDETISPGGCWIATDLGEVDATLDTKMKEIARTLAVNV